MMARTITVLCDVHLNTLDERVDGHTLPVWGGKTIDLCDECEVALYKPLASFVDAFGINADGKTTRGPYRKRTPTPPLAPDETPDHVCELCGHGVRTESALWQHVKSKHDMGRPAYRAAVA